MRKYIKQNIIEILCTLHEAHDCIKNYIEKNERENAQAVLGDCQQVAIEIGNLIEETESESGGTIVLLENYCEELYKISTDHSLSGTKIKRVLDKAVKKIENDIRNSIKITLEVVFMPYKASMWDSMESIWKAANEDIECEVYVVPIPYYDKNEDQTLGIFHYEGMQYPSYVPITNYEEYDIKERSPDVVFVHNPYENVNYVTTIDPQFYAGQIKKYTSCLVYVPYFLFPKTEIASHLISVPILFYADVVVAQNEIVRQAYIDEIQQIEWARDGRPYEVWALGSPKTDKMYQICQKGIDIPEQWKNMAEGKKKIFINTNVSLILNNNEKFVENFRRVFEILIKRQDVFVVWREHPLTDETFKSMRPGLIDDYNVLKAEFIKSGLGVFDTNVEAYEAICFSDCYFGAGGSLLPIYAMTGKPMLVTAYNYPGNISEKKVKLITMLKQVDKSMHFSERYANFLDLLLDNLDEIMKYKEKRYEFLSKITFNIDGTVGQSIMDKVKNKCLSEENNRK